MSESFVRGLRLSVPYAVVSFVLSMTFGLLARQAGFSALQAVADGRVGGVGHRPGTGALHPTRGARARRRGGGPAGTAPVNVWLLIACCVATTVLIKAAGPVLLGGRDLPPFVARIVACLAPALLAALVVTAALADGQRLQAGADTVGVLAGGVLLWWGRSVVLAVLVTVLVTALLRAVT